MHSDHDCGGSGKLGMDGGGCEGRVGGVDGGGEGGGKACRRGERVASPHPSTVPPRIAALLVCLAGGEEAVGEPLNMWQVAALVVMLVA